MFVICSLISEMCYRFWHTSVSCCFTCSVINKMYLLLRHKSVSCIHLFRFKSVKCFTGSVRSFPHSRLIIGFVTRLTRRVPLVEQELLTLPEHLSSTPVFSGVRVTRSLVLCVCFVDRCLSFCTFTFGHCFVCSSSIYRFWLPLWYLQTILMSVCRL